MNKPMSNTVKVLLALLVVAAAVLEVLEYRKRHSVAPTANPPPEKVQKASPAEKKKTKAAPRKKQYRSSGD